MDGAGSGLPCVDRQRGSVRCREQTAAQAWRGDSRPAIPQQELRISARDRDTVPAERACTADTCGASRTHAPAGSLSSLVTVTAIVPRPARMAAIAMRLMMSSGQFNAGMHSRKGRWTAP